MWGKIYSYNFSPLVLIYLHILGSDLNKSVSSSHRSSLKYLKIVLMFSVVFSSYIFQRSNLKYIKGSFKELFNIKKKNKGTLGNTHTVCVIWKDITSYALEGNKKAVEK